MSDSEFLGVYIRVKVKPDKREEFIGLISELTGNVDANEPDALTFAFFQADDPNEFVFFERFRDEAAYERHRDADYHVAMSPAGWACLSEEPHIEQLRGIVSLER